MSAFAWLKQQAPSSPDFSEQERAVISDFLFLWSLFESHVLGSSANAERIVETANKWLQAGSLTADTFAPTLAYFRERYFHNGNETGHFHHLNLRDNDMRDLVRTVLSGESKGVAEDCAVVFIVVFRFRNNLFHGLKWAYWLQDQLNNFTQANTVLKKGLELAGPIAAG